jgi:RNA polymerase sigma-70 factor, ECF subfamily
MPQDQPPAAPPTSEEAWNGLVERAAGGDQSAMAELYDASSARVLGLALRILGDRSAAEDALVEVYAQAWRDASSFDAGVETCALGC